MEDQQGRPWMGVLGLVVVVGLVWGGLRYVKRTERGGGKGPAVSPSTVETAEKRLEGITNFEVPDVGEKAELKDVSGGSGVGVARRVEEGGGIRVEILASLPDPDGGEFYEGWLSSEKETRSLGELVSAKGGFLVTKVFGERLADFKKVGVTLEKKKDATMEKKVLEGIFGK